MIHALLDGEIPSAELPPIQAHLGACAECRTRLAEEQELLETSDRLIELIEVPAAVKPATVKRLSTGRRTWPRTLAWAATVVLAAGLGYSARDAGPVSTEQKVAAAETVFVVAPPPATVAEEPQAATTSTKRRDERTKPAPRDMAPAREVQEGRVAVDSSPTAKVAAGANVAAATPPVPARDTISAIPPLVPTPTAQLRGAARRLGDTQLRLDELVVTGVADRAAKLSSLTTPVPVTFSDAVRKLDGSLRLIEGLIPERLESLGNAVRVVYATGFGELVLSQQVEDGKLRYTLIAPRGLPADSLEKLRARVRD
jgi:hypothetical protein